MIEKVYLVVGYEWDGETMVSENIKIFRKRTSAEIFQTVIKSVYYSVTIEEYDVSE